MKKVGVIMLNTHFPRLIGDIGNPESFDVPCEIIRLEAGKVDNIVTNHIAHAQTNEILETAKRLEANGASVVTTSCGFLGTVQGQIREQLRIPFIATSLSLLPLLRIMYGNNAPIGVITFDSQKLKPQHFMGHYSSDLKVVGIENGQELHRVIKQDETTLDHEKAQQDVLEAAKPLVEKGVCCLLLECTNLSPYKQALRDTYNIAVYDLMDALHWLAKA